MTAAQEIRLEPQPKQQQFSELSVDIGIFGGSAGGGKTWSLLFEPTYHTDNAKFGCIIFRRTYPQITLEGGLWDESEELYPYLGATPTKGRLTWTFPSGASVAFRSMENEQDRYNYDGSQIPLIEFDQLESFTEKQFFYMLSRNRSTCGVRPYIRASVNPQPGWLAKFLEWWWDQETGYAIPERSGKVRWFARVGDAIKWGKREDLMERYPGCAPKSVTFIMSKLDDNQILLRKDPGYLSNLMALSLVDRERLLHGNWKISVAGNIFRREWWKYLDAPLRNEDVVDDVRFWDQAATPQEGSNDPDWTAGVRMQQDRHGRLIVAHVNRFRGTPLQNEVAIEAQARLDGPAVRIGKEQEPGASGKNDVDHYSRNVLLGYSLVGVPATRKKLLRWAPLSAQAERGNVYLLRGSWNQDFIDELEGCKGEDEKNDQADAASGALEMIRVPTGAWDSKHIHASASAHERNADESIDPLADEVEWTND